MERSVMTREERKKYDRERWDAAEILYERGREELKENGREYYLGIKEGDRVKILHACSYLDLPKGSTGIVSQIIEFNDDNPIEDHGFIYIKFENETEETFAHWKWRNSLEIQPPEKN
jgi:hypothetical protein